VLYYCTARSTLQNCTFDITSSDKDTIIAVGIPLQQNERGEQA
jgi:hypothetical protein